MVNIFKRPKDDSANPAPAEVYNWRIYGLAASAAMGSAMFGYDSAFIGGTMSLPSFQSRFGLDSSTGTDLAALKANIVSTFQGGCFFGVLLCYYLVERLGRRWVLIGCGALFDLGAILQLVASGNLALIYAGRVLTGLAVGSSSMIIPVYISESGPPAIRGRLIGVFEIFLQFSQIVGFWVNYGVNIHISGSSDTQWHVPFALQIIPGSLLSICMFLQPESPRWLLNAGRTDQARRVLQRLRKLPADHPYLNWEINTVLQQIEEETAMGANRGLLEKLREIKLPTNRRRLLLGIALMFIQNMSGINALNYYSPSIFQSIGFTGTSVGLLATGIFGIVKAFATMLYMIWGVDALGRRQSLMIGSTGAAIALFYLGAYAKLSGSFEAGQLSAGDRTPGAYVAIVMIYIFAVFYAISWNGIPWIFCAEIFPMGIRSICLVFTTCAQWLGQFTIVYSTPYMMTDITYGTFLLFACSVVFGFVFTFLLIPETKGISLEDMDVLFTRKALGAADIPRISHGGDIWEMRVDLLSPSREPLGTTNLPPLSYVQAQIKLLQSLSDMPILFTIRTAPQGGKFPPDAENDALALMLMAVEERCKYIDVEIEWSPELVNAVVEKKGTSKIIASFHDWTGDIRWTSDLLREKYATADAFGDIIKLSILSADVYDCHELALFERSHSSKSPKPLLAVGMGHLSGKTAIITGGNTGLGYEAAIQLLNLKLSNLILAVRSLERGEDAAAKLRKQHPSATIDVWQLDMNSCDSIQEFARRAESHLSRIDIVILNAGIMKMSFSKNPSTGHEETLQVNYLSTVLLAILLLPVLKAKRKPDGDPAHLTIVNAALTLAASFPNRDAKPLLPSFDDPKIFSSETYNSSKLLAHMFLWKLSDIVSADNVIVNLSDPAWCRGTALGRDAPGLLRWGLWAFGATGRTPRVGASCFVDAVVNKGKESHGCFLMSWNIHPFAAFLYTSEGKVVTERLWAETLDELEFAGARGILKSM
ncbi:putative quinate permease [Colletotrichum sp. SAR 10_76]|nr:putative quinate permease [Colletotrichum sp. SAR 10_76]